MPARMGNARLYVSIGNVYRRDDVRNGTASQ